MADNSEPFLRRVLTAAVLIVPLLVAGAAFGRGELGSKVDEEVGRGKSAVANVYRSINRPTAISVRIRAGPRQDIIGRYRVTCYDYDLGAQTGGKFDGRAPLVEKIPITVGRPDRCDVNATGILGGRGRIEVQLFAKQEAGTRQGA